MASAGVFDEGIAEPRPPPEVVTRLRAAGCVFAGDEARLFAAAADTPDELAAMVRRRVTGEPLEHVLGWAEFCGLRVAVGPGVFVPRRRTEFLVEQAVLLGAQVVARPRVVVDLCCGSGAVGAALAAQLDGVALHTADVDPVAVACARRNLAALGCPGARVYQGDLDEPLPATLRGRVHVLLANTPYVPTAAPATMPPEARLHEPRRALDGGETGLDVQARAAVVAPSWLARRGHLLLETAAEQARGTSELLARNGLVPRIAHSDERDATVVIGTRPG